MTDQAIVYVVHAVDTEGPLYEPIDATFQRLRELFGIDLEASHANLQKLRNREIDLGEQAELVSKVVDPKVLAYNDSWDKVDAMLSRIMAPAFRDAVPDSLGNGWKYTWHCLDHVQFETNPRRRDMGFHNIHDRYLEFLDKYASTDTDAIEWHFHPMSFYREANRCATSYLNSPHLYETIARRIIDRDFFPAVFRAGFQTERPDSHWFLEQWIPFDASNMALEDYSELEAQADTRNGRFNDWRRAPNDWRIYNPDHRDYQVPGQCRRYIARFLNVNTRIGCIDQYETDRAFQRALDTGGPVLLGVASHDFRDMEPEVNQVRELLQEARTRFPDVQVRYATAREAFRAAVHGGYTEPLELGVALTWEDGVCYLRVEALQGEVFGPQPFLAIRTVSGRYVHDNFDFGLDGRTWYYVFDAESVHSDDLHSVGVAANNIYGETFVKTIRVTHDH